MIDPSYYETISDTQWFIIYNYHIEKCKFWRDHITLLTAPYMVMIEMDILRDMERQTILSELRRVNCTKNSNTSTALAATR